VNSLRRAARLLSALSAVGQDESVTALTPVIRLAALAAASAELRQAQRRAAQAAAAKSSGRTAALADTAGPCHV
jgi:hypothetical protein